jgi:hypothetical protein
MNGTDETKHSPRKLLATVFAVAMLLTVLAGSGAITSTAAAASPDADLELVPHYKDVTYVLDPVTFDQRFDAIGSWEKTGDAELSDSRLVMDADEGAVLEIEDNLANYFEARLMFDSANATVTFKLTDGTNYTSIAIAASGAVTYALNNGTTATGSVAASGVAAGEWIKVGIEFTEAAVIFTAIDSTGDSLGSASIADAILTFDAVTEVSVKSAGVGVVGYADYAFGSLTQTEFVAAALDGTDLNSSPALEKKFQKFLVEFGQKDMVPGTYSDEAVTHALYGGEISDRTLASDRYLNQTDMGELLSAHKETVEPITGTATYKGWSDLQKDNEDTLLAYLADQHDVSKDQVTVIDYYMDGVALNYTFNSAMTDAVEQAWFDYSRDMADDLGAQTAYNDEAAVNSVTGTMTMAITKQPTDLNYFYYPTSVEAAEFEDAMDVLSDRLREKTIGAAVMIPETFENITVASKTNPDAYAMDVDGSVWNNAMKDLDRAYQFTDAALGNILQGATYMLFDLDSMATAMDWSVMQDGKLTATPLTFASVYGSEVVVYSALVVLIAIPLVALLIVGGVFGAKKVKARKKQ